MPQSAVSAVQTALEHAAARDAVTAESARGQGLRNSPSFPVITQLSFTTFDSCAWSVCQKVN